MEARRELIEAVRERYRSAGRTEKKQILDEFVEWPGFHRKHAIRVFEERTQDQYGPGRARAANLQRSGDHGADHPLGSGGSNLWQTTERQF